MKQLAVCLLAAVMAVVGLAENDENALNDIGEGIVKVMEPELKEVDDRVKAQIKIQALSLLWQQQMAMEKNRMEGDSGIMSVRNDKGGTKPWATNTWSRLNGQAAIHNHANNIRTIGMGEVAVVMNGVHFRTRHNDYRLNQAHSTSSEFGATEPVEFPPVPPEVLAKPNVPEQIAEMKEFFKAFADQNVHHRNYTPYFKPVMTYMQGMWTVDTEKVKEPFFSDRHSIEAETWFQLQQDFMFATWTGKKDLGENLAALPTMVYGVHEDGTPKRAQWNYKILTHPLKTDIPLNRFRLINDLSPIMRSYKRREAFVKTRSARFQLHPANSDDSNFDGIWGDEGSTKDNNFLDELMYEVPGMNNYPADIPDSNFKASPLLHVDGERVLNAGYHHRQYSLPSADASGLRKSSRGFADNNLFVALTNHSNIAPVLARKCVNRKNCQYEEVRTTYAIPLEIVYMTPLLRWNPYNILYTGDNNDNPLIGPDGTKSRRGNKDDPDKAYNGSSSRYYYRTPAEMFEGREDDPDSADTSGGSVYVLDQQGNVRRTTASGTRVFTPNIPGVGAVRTRYPIFNTYQEGNPIYKELSALTDIVLQGATYAHMYLNPLGGFNTDDFNLNERFTFSLRKSTFRPHVHTFILTSNQLKAMRLGAGNRGYTVEVQTQTTAEHSHSLVVGYQSGSGRLKIFECDGKSVCRDGHPNFADCLDCSKA